MGAPQFTQQMDIEDALTNAKASIKASVRHSAEKHQQLDDAEVRLLRLQRKLQDSMKADVDAAAVQVPLHAL